MKRDSHRHGKIEVSNSVKNLAEQLGIILEALALLLS